MGHKYKTFEKKFERSSHMKKLWKWSYTDKESLSTFGFSTELAFKWRNVSRITAKDILRLQNPELYMI